MENVRYFGNSLYGCLKDKFNPLYDPRQSNNVCVTGQLLLLDLIEKIEPYCELAQSNTDGVFLLVKDQETATKIKEIAKEWEIRTRLTLEWDEYVKLVQKDVNNYIIVDKDGGYKSKGAYLKKLSPIDADLLIVNKALIDYFTKGISIRDTIVTAKNLGDFQKIVKVSSLYEYALVNGQKIKEKVLRVFASKDTTATGVYKVKLVDGEERIEKIANTPEKCFVNNEDLNDAGIPDNLDLEYYVSMAESRLDDFYNGEKKSKAKPKSEIKGVNEIVYNAIIDLDLSQFDTFIELLQYVNDNSVANIRQMEILTKLNYFEKYGGNKKLFSVMTEFYKGKNCYVKTNSDQLKLEKISKLKDFEYYEPDSEFSTKENVEFRFKYLGYFITHNECDRAKLVVDDVFPLKRKSDGKQFGYSVVGISIGSGKETRYTVFNRDFSRCGEIEKGDVVLCIGWKRDGEYFSMNEYKKIY